MAAAKASLGRYFAFYNTERRHQSLNRRTPDSVYYESAAKMAAWPEEALIALSNFWGPFLTHLNAVPYLIIRMWHFAAKLKRYCKLGCVPVAPIQATVLLS